MSTPRLSAAQATAARPPVRLVHLGLGAFHRAHQVWYTQRANEAAGGSGQAWGYASFTGRSPRTADALLPQDGLYTLVVRSADGDAPELIEALVEPRPAGDVARFVALLAAPGTAVVTLTVTEAGYHLDTSGSLNTEDPDVAADLFALRSAASPDAARELRTAAGKIVAGLAARRAAGSGGLAVMSCDNLTGNGATTRASVLGLAALVDAELAAWIERRVSFPSSSIDRITPAAESELAETVAKACGWRDAAPVVTEPFASWVIEGEFPAGRPHWEDAGAEFVADVAPFERRKLWLLNGAHSLLAYAGQLRGYATVAEAIADPALLEQVSALWDEAAHHLTAPELRVPEYREALLERFRNPRIRHLLRQIGTDGATKQQMRAVPILRAERKAGRPGDAALASLAAWEAFLLSGAEVRDTRAEEIRAAAGAEDPVLELLALIAPDLARDEELLGRLRAEVARLREAAASPSHPSSPTHPPQ